MFITDCSSSYMGFREMFLALFTLIINNRKLRLVLLWISIWTWVLQFPMMLQWRCGYFISFSKMYSIEQVYSVEIVVQSFPYHSSLWAKIYYTVYSSSLEMHKKYMTKRDFYELFPLALGGSNFSRFKTIILVLLWTSVFYQRDGDGKINCDCIFDMFNAYSLNTGNLHYTLFCKQHINTCQKYAKPEFSQEFILKEENSKWFTVCICNLHSFAGFCYLERQGEKSGASTAF